MTILDCLLPAQIEKIKKAYRDGELDVGKLFKMSPEARIKFFEQYVGDSAKNITAKFEKAFMAPLQKEAFRKIAYELEGYKPLYKGVSVEDSAKLAEKIDVRDLRKMTREEVKSALGSVLSDKLAEGITKRFEHLKKTGNLANWEKKVIGTEKLRADKKLMKNLAKIDTLDNLGILNPKQVEDFMPSLIETNLGVDLTMEEAEKLSKLNGEVKDVYDKIVKADDWTWENKDNVIDYFKKLKEIKDFTDLLEPNTFAKGVNKFINYFRASLLASEKTPINSALYQVIPSMERVVVKRIASGQMFPNSKGWIANQFKMAAAIYNKTGFDISRMQTLDDGFRIFAGEKFTGLPKKKGKLFNALGRFVNLGPKWGAGGTDMIIANTTRADTSWLLARQQAKKELKAGTLKKEDATKRIKELVKESYSFSPKSEEAQYIRDAGILDANASNLTGNDAYSDFIVGLRNKFKVGNVDLGKLLVPFAKISSANVSRGIQTATGLGIIKDVRNLKRATQMEDGVEKAKATYKAITGLIGVIGLSGLTAYIASQLDDDDYIGGWETISFKQYGLAKSRNAQAGMVRLWGHWVPIRYLPIINIPLSAVMMSRQSKERGGDYTAGYLKGIIGGVLEAPFISNVWSMLKKGGKMAKINKNKEDMPTQKDVIDWSLPRLIPAIISRRIMNALKDTKYDFMGREVVGGYIFREDTTNDVILEFNNLDKTGNMPVIDDPDNAGKVSVEELNKMKQEYTEAVIEMINTEDYKALSDKDKKKIINKLRSAYILNRI